MRGQLFTRTLPATAALLAAVPLSVSAFAGTEQLIDFEGLQNGLIVANGNTDRGFLPGVSISVDNFNSSTDLAVIFDTTLSNTEDPDLEGPSWGGGNLPLNTVLGNALIIQEGTNKRIGNDGNVVFKPDDEGRRAAGELTFTFDQDITSFGLDLIDVEGPSEYGKDSGFVATFIDGNQQVSVGFGSFVDPNSVFYQPGVAFGDNSANSIKPITAQQLGLDSFDQVVINLGGSSAVDNIRFTAVPSPTAAGAGLVALVALAARRRRRTVETESA